MMDQQNYYAYFADYLPHRIKKTKQYDDYMDEFFEYSSPCAARQGCDDEFLDATKAEPASSLSRSYSTAANGNWRIAFNHNDEVHFANHFFDNRAGFDTEMGDDQSATEMLWDPELLGSDLNADHQTRTRLAPAKFPATLTEPFGQAVASGEQTRQTQQNNSHCDSFTADDSTPDDDSNQAIGTALKNGRYKCIMQACANISFKRPTELRRHYNTIHAVQKPEFWCEVEFCERSLAGAAGVAAGGQPFHRRYRLQAHMQKVHHDGFNTGSSEDMTDG